MLPVVGLTKSIYHLLYKVLIASKQSHGIQHKTPFPI